MTAMDEPNQRGPHTHRMDAPSDVTTWTVVHTVRNVPTDDGRDMTLRDEWWEVPTFVVEALDAASPAVPAAEGLRERIAAAIPTYTFIKPDHYAATDAIPLSQVVEDVIAAFASTPEAGRGRPMTTPDPRERRPHAWISNTAFARMTGIVKICMDCGLGLEKGERLIAAERWCPGKRLEALR